MSRRDWFRLRLPVTPSEKQQRLGAEPPTGLQSIDDPINHGGFDLSSLPPMHEATLDAQEVAALFADLEQHATAVQFVARSNTGNASDRFSHVDIKGARDQLLGGNVRKLQIRYQWQNAHWIDTLERRPDGFRLVRIQHAKVSK
ncbi:MAG: hypothetical protein GXP24_14565 [Planctomycetes bacterium]|nr:hypothetical protein [Planctomycetota bacterium]